MRVKYHQPEYEEGLEFDIGGLLFPNGEELEVSDEELETYEAKNDAPLDEALSSVQFAEVDGKAYVPPPDPETTSGVFAVTPEEVLVNPQEPSEVGDN